MNKKTKHITVVEDDEFLSEMIEQILENEGYEVSVSHTGDELLNLETINTDLILLDLYLGASKEISHAVINRLGKNGYNEIPLIMMSADDSVVEYRTREPVNDALVKPFTPETLLYSVKSNIVS